MKTAYAILTLSCFTVLPAIADDLGDGASGDPNHGRRVFYNCKSCHSLGNDQSHKIGPNLFGLFGRRAGSASGYEAYSAALREANFVWTEEQLDQWLADPNGFLPGNKMAFAGLRREKDRQDLIAYLKKAGVP